MNEGPAFKASVLLLFASIVLGGATTSGYLRDVLLQLLSVPLLLLALWIWFDRLGRRSPAMRQALSWSPELMLAAAMAACGLAIILAQVVPLFGAPGWAGLSAHITAAGGAPLESAGGTGSSSLDPAMSIAAVAGIIPALALFLLVSTLDVAQRQRLAGWFVAFGFVCLALGILQVLQGPDSALRFFAFSNRDEAIGFFANRNHFAAQLYATLLMGVAWFVTREERVLSSRTRPGRKLLWLAVVGCAALLLFAGIALARSRAGILFALACAAVVVAMSPTLLATLSGRESRHKRVRGVIFVAMAAVLLLVGQLGAERFLSRFDSGLVDQLRTTLNEVTLQAMRDAMPTGTGLGTFPSVYAVYESNQQLMSRYVNRAHDDWLEFALETGVAGILLIALFLVWFALRVFHIWIRPAKAESGNALIAQQFASLVVLFFMLHSVVDYPLRTATLLAYFAACCALMTPARRATVPLTAGKPPPRPSRRGQRSEARDGAPVALSPQ